MGSVSAGIWKEESTRRRSTGNLVSERSPYCQRSQTWSDSPCVLLTASFFEDPGTKERNAESHVMAGDVMAVWNAGKLKSISASPATLLVSGEIESQLTQSSLRL